MPSHPADNEPLIGMHLSLPMGFGPSCTFFEAVTETIVDIVNNSWFDIPRVIPHSLSALADSPPIDPLILQGVLSSSQESALQSLRNKASTRLKSSATKYIDVNVDNHLLLAKGPPALRTAIRDHSMHTIDSIFKQADPCNPYHSEPITTKKLKRGDAAWSTIQKILGGMINTVDHTITLSVKNSIKIIMHLENCMNKQRLGQECIQKLLGLRSFVVAVPGRLGLFISLQQAIRQPHRILLTAKHLSELTT